MYNKGNATLSNTYFVTFHPLHHLPFSSFHVKNKPALMQLPSSSSPCSFRASYSCFFYTYWLPTRCTLMLWTTPSFEFINPCRRCALSRRESASIDYTWGYISQCLITAILWTINLSFTECWRCLRAIKHGGKQQQSLIIGTQQVPESVVYENNNNTIDFNFAVALYDIQLQLIMPYTSQ